jgi:hypothetical protein
MTLANSSLALAADGLADVLQAALTDVNVLVDSPAGAQKTAEATPGSHFLNMFFYRIAPSQVHASQMPDEPLFLRLFALLTPFPKKSAGSGEDYPALRILGEALRYFHENPVSATLHAKPGGAGTAYRIQAILQAPAMEELNHIWTTQGSDLSYQISAAYEFLLVPVDPATAAMPPGDVLSAVYEVRTDPTAMPGLEAAAVPPPGQTGPPYLPVIFAEGPNGSAATADIASASGQVGLRLAGAPRETALITLSVRDAAGTELREVIAVEVIRAARADNPAAVVSVAANLAGAKSVYAEVRAADATGQPLLPDAVGAQLTLTVDGGP